VERKWGAFCRGENVAGGGSLKGGVFPHLGVFHEAKLAEKGGGTTESPRSRNGRESHRQKQRRAGGGGRTGHRVPNKDNVNVVPRLWGG